MQRKPGRCLQQPCNDASRDDTQKVYPWAHDSGLLLDSNCRVERAALAGSRTTSKNAALRANLRFLRFATSAAGFGSLCNYSVPSENDTSTIAVS
jgi:hypothetical protein